jgi:hypothetical protein
MKKIFALLVLTTAMFVSAAQAQSLLTWDMSGVVATNSLSSTTVAANLQTGGSLNALTRLTVSNNNAANAFAGNNWNLTSTFDETQRYFTFTLQAQSGYEMTLTNLGFTINGSNTAPNTGRWGYSVGGGAFVLQNTFTIPFTLPTSLSTWDFDDFTTTNAVEFRFWGFGNVSINGGTPATSGALRIGNGVAAGSDLVLNGSVALVPEPSSVALLGLAGLGFAGYVIRRRLRA